MLRKLGLAGFRVICVNYAVYLRKETPSWWYLYSLIRDYSRTLGFLGLSAQAPNLGVRAMYGAPH